MSKGRYTKKIAELKKMHEERTANLKRKPGRPSKKPINFVGLKLCYEKGFTDMEVCQALYIDERTLNNWKKQDPEFFQSLKDWKLKADAEVERSLYERATGYSHPETKVQYVDGEWQSTDLTKHYPPDATSMIFWLKNRKPSEWREKTETAITGKDGGPIMIASNIPDDKRDALTQAYLSIINDKDVDEGK